MSDLSFIDSMDEADIDALLAGDVDSISEGALDILAGLDERQFAQLTGAEVQPVDDTPQGTRNQVGFLQGLGLTEEQGTAVAESGFSKFLTGVGREASAISRGLQQIAGSPEEAAVLAAAEERERKIFSELDDGQIDMEDLGQAVPILATMIAPGGQVSQGVTAVAKGLNALKNLGSTLGAQAAMVGAIEGAKATTMDESRAANAASGAAATVVGGKLIGGLGKSLHAGAIGKMLTVAGLGAVMKGEGGRRAAGGIMGFINRNLLGRAPRDVQGEISRRTAAGIAGPEARRIVETGTKAKIGLAEQSGGLATGRSAAWDTFLDIVKGPVSPKTGKRLAGGSLAGGAAPKAAKESGMDVVAERNRIVGVLMEAAKKPREGAPNIVDFDAGALEGAWRNLKNDTNFKALYTSKTGVLNKKGKAVESFIEDLLKQGTPADSTVLIDDIVEKGLGTMRRQAEDALEVAAKATQSKVNKGFKLNEAEVKQRAAAAALATTIDQEGGWAESLSRISQGDTWEWIDLTSTLQEQIDELEASK